ncbi:hypothetical protein RKY35_10795, partial [Streptococcus pneumoniae]|nr:hypothetical protein [Streptococcus pneumoniae]MDS2909595.1 hypothetical protein [Streptococcus pneumoniae]MDS2937087.1 hypothetical protein [Streptococcus pneumoniae]MDS3843310.1 hypothetical protein [Streptococcus pneumoniae]
MVKINKICSIQGSSVENEDIVGSQNQYFWIIGGATDLYNSKEEIGYSVSEVVHILSESLSVNCKPQLFTPNLKTIQNPCLSLDPGWFLFS